VNPAAPQSAAAWRAALAAACGPGGPWRTFEVLPEVGSTQDAARSRAPGTVVTTLRQTAGRGRLGRGWADTGNHGLAVTFVLEAERGARPSLALAAAIAAARAIEGLAGGAVALKWPNDLVVGGKKLGGILIERLATVTLVGIGINVGQPGFPSELAHATSLRILGHDLARLDLLVGLCREFAAILDASDPAIEAEFVRRDALRGAWVRVGDGPSTVEGRLERLEPLRGLSIRPSGAAEVRFVPAARAAILAWRPPVDAVAPADR